MGWLNTLAHRASDWVNTYNPDYQWHDVPIEERPHENIFQFEVLDPVGTEPTRDISQDAGRIIHYDDVVDDSEFQLGDIFPGASRDDPKYEIGRRLQEGAEKKAMASIGYAGPGKKTGPMLSGGVGAGGGAAAPPAPRGAPFRFGWTPPAMPQYQRWEAQEFNIEDPYPAPDYGPPPEPFQRDLQRYRKLLGE